MKNLANLSLLILSSFLLPGCGDDEKEDQTPEPTVPAVTIDGTWRNYYVYSQLFDANNYLTVESKKTDSPTNQNTRTFTPPATYVEKNYANVKTGTYNLSQTQLTVTFPQDTFIYQVDSLTATRLVLRNTITYPTGEKLIVVSKAVR